MKSIKENNEKIFLTRKQLLDAIRIDLNQYESQFDLLQELCPIITDSRNIAAKEGRTDCVLISRGNKSKTRRMPIHDLSDFLLNALTTNTYPLSVMADICSRVFQTRSWPGKDAATGIKGIWIKTEMAHFKCRQCGNCCRNLKYHNDCTTADFRRWKSLGRNDILERVMIIDAETKTPQFRIWREPGTYRFYPECPWLVPSEVKGRFDCGIQDVKPEYCRQYPLTRKHALMTGCRGTF